MNYVTYMRKFQEGGSLNEDQQLVMVFLEVPEAFKSVADEIQPGLLSDEAVENIKQLNEGVKANDAQSIQAVQELMQDQETVELLKQLYQRNPEVIQSAMQQAQQGMMEEQAAMMRMGGKIEYLKCLKSGGHVGSCKCGCAVKMSDGGDTKFRDLRGDTRSRLDSLIKKSTAYAPYMGQPMPASERLDRLKELFSRKKREQNSKDQNDYKIQPSVKR